MYKFVKNIYKKSKYVNPIEIEWRKETYPDQLEAAIAHSKIDPILAVKELEKLALADSALANVYLGDIFANGRGIERNLTKGVFWYKKSMDLGSDEGAFRLAFTYWYQEEVDKALSILKMLADRGFSPASYLLGSIYFDGNCVDRDVKIGLEYWSSSERLGHLEAKRRISIYLRSGNKGLIAKFRGTIKLISLILPYIMTSLSNPESARLRGWSD